MALNETVRRLYDDFGQQKPMGAASPSPRLPHYFLVRTFMGETDLAVILNTKRCSYQCKFCQLPAKSSRQWIAGDDVVAQFEFVVKEVKHALSILERVSLSNEGSVLDESTLADTALIQIARAVQELRRVRTLVLETRLEYLDVQVIERIKAAAPRPTINILTGFETLDQEIRDKILVKRETMETFLQGLDKVAECGAELGAYVLFKPSQTMTDEEAFREAERSIDFLLEECRRRAVGLSIRLNPMYLAAGSGWGKIAAQTQEYTPPRLTDLMRLAEEKAREGARIYIGLSTEGLDGSGGTYHSREDYYPSLVKPIKMFNDGKISSFDWEAVNRSAT